MHLPAPPHCSPSRKVWEGGIWKHKTHHQTATIKDGRVGEEYIVEAVLPPLFEHLPLDKPLRGRWHATTRAKVPMPLLNYQS